MKGEAGGVPVQGNVNVGGSVHVLGTGISPCNPANPNTGNTALSLRTGNIFNGHLNGGGYDIDSALEGYIDYVGWNKNNLNTKVRIKQGCVDMSQGSGAIGVTASSVRGIYITDGADGNGDFLNSTTIANWMILNYSLGLNGFKVINGYSDILAPFLLSVGGSAGATGWFANLRNFSLASFEPPPKGGRRPLVRYLSNALLNRITAPELDQLRKITPQVLNGLSTDRYYSKGDGSIPKESAHEALQTWEALKSLTNKLSPQAMPDRLRSLLKLINNAGTVYAAISKTPTQLQNGSDHLAEMEEAIYLFARRSSITL